jgi:hypothetical protein
MIGSLNVSIVNCFSAFSMGLPHPFAPEIEWRIAVARRFHIPAVDSLYREIVQPVLDDEGIALECSYAADEPEYPDYWANRMTLILELADIHVLLDIEPNANTLWEFQLSESYAKSAGANALSLSFGWRPRLPESLTPISLRIRSESGEDSFSCHDRRGLVHVGESDRANDFPERLKNQLALAKQCRAELIRQAAGMSRANNSGDPARSSQVRAEFQRMMVLFSNLKNEHTNVDQIRDLIPRDVAISVSPLADRLAPPDLRERFIPVREATLLLSNSMNQWFIDVRANRVVVRGRFWECFRETRAAVIDRLKRDLPWMATGFNRRIVSIAVLFGLYAARGLQKPKS